MKNYFVIHGSFGSPFGNWFSWLYDFIEYVKYESEKEFADKIATEQVFIPNAGHINSESGYGTFEDIVSYL